MNKEEAFEIAKKLTETSANADIVSLCEYIFPELAESEDEKIRKRIYNYINVTLDGNESAEKEKWLAWLEKQGSVGKIVSRCKTSWYNEGKIQGQIEGLSDEEKYQQGLHDALEKQGLQKSFNDTDEEIAEVVKDISVLDLVEQKPVDINGSLINKMVDDYKNTDEYVEGDYKGKPVNCMVRAYRQGIKDILSIYKENHIKHAWSEKDEKVLSLMQKIVRDSYLSAKKANELSDWLNSLKERF